MTPTLTPSRLTLARKRRGRTKSELATLVGVSLKSLGFYENGHQTPTPETLARLAHALDFPIAFLVGPDLEEPPKGGTSYRALTRMTARQQGKAEASAALALC